MGVKPSSAEQSCNEAWAKGKISNIDPVFTYNVDVLHYFWFKKHTVLKYLGWLMSFLSAPLSFAPDVPWRGIFVGNLPA